MVGTNGLSLLRMLSPGTREWLVELGQRKTYCDCELIHNRGDRNPRMGVVIEGAVRLGRLRPDGGRTFAGLIRKGEHFGDVLMEQNRPRTHDAIASGETTVDYYDRKRFAEMQTNPEVLRALYLIAARRLGQALAMHDDLRGLPRDVHIAKVLLQQWSLNDRQPVIALIQEDLAAMIGVTPMTLSKGIARLKRAGLIETGYRQITIRDPQGLRAWLAERSAG